MITALHCACEEGHLGIIEILLDNKMEVQLILNQAWTHSATVPGDLSFGNIAFASDPLSALQLTPSPLAETRPLQTVTPGLDIPELPDSSSPGEVDEKGSRIPWVHHHGDLKKPINPYANTQTTVSMEDDRATFAL